MSGLSSAIGARRTLYSECMAFLLASLNMPHPPPPLPCCCPSPWHRRATLSPTLFFPLFPFFPAQHPVRVPHCVDLAANRPRPAPAPPESARLPRFIPSLRVRTHGVRCTPPPPAAEEASSDVRPLLVIPPCCAYGICMHCKPYAVPFLPSSSHLTVPVVRVMSAIHRFVRLPSLVSLGCTLLIGGALCHLSSTGTGTVSLAFLVAIPLTSFAAQYQNLQRARLIRI
eukprot:364806-Chlamydomonas_euryale.AAC.4